MRLDCSDSERDHAESDAPRSVRRIAYIRYDAAFGCFTVGAQHNFAKPLIPQNQHCCYRYYFKDKNLC